MVLLSLKRQEVAVILARQMDDISTKTGNSGASKATDFQPTTGNPQNDVGGLQSTQSIQSTGQGLTQDSLGTPRTLTVQTDRSATTIAAQTTPLQLTEAKSAGWLSAVIIIVIIGLMIIAARRLKKTPKPTQPVVFLEVVDEEAPKPKKTPKPTKTRPRKKTKTKR